MAGYKEASPGTKETLVRDARLILGVIDNMQTTLNSLKHEVESMERYADRLDESEVEEDPWDEWHRPPGH